MELLALLPPADISPMPACQKRQDLMQETIGNQRESHSLGELCVSLLINKVGDQREDKLARA